jgi:hypothetical protein
MEERLYAVLNRLDVFLTLANAAINNPTYKPRKEEMQFIVDQVIDLSEEMREAISVPDD